MQRAILGWIGVGLLGLGAWGVASQGSNGLPKAVAEIERINGLREGLAGAFGERGVPATAETFGEVCRPVGMQAKQLAASTGWTVRQLAAKYRNPANRPDDEAARVIAAMGDDPSLLSLVMRTAEGDRPGLRYFRRIDVQEACLACHGARAARPAFVQDGYPDDRAFDFAVGDLRGVYAVFLPD
jgi:hypothetical protein